MPLIFLKCSCGHFEVFTRHRKIPGLRKEIYVAIELMEVPVTYDGKVADEHKIDLYALGGSLQGIARVLAVSSHFVVTGEYAKQFGSQGVKVYASEPKAKCFELSAIIEFAQQQQLFSGFGGALFGGIVAFVVAKASGNREEMKLLSQRLEQAIKELGNRDQQVIDRMMSTIEKMADALRPSVRNAVEPVGRECDTLTIGKKTDPYKTTIDKATRDAIWSEGDVTLTDLRDWEVVFTELDKESKTGKVRLVGDESNTRIKADVSDPAFLMPDNKYLASYAHNQVITIKAKAMLKEGELDRFYVSDAI